MKKPITILLILLVLFAAVLPVAAAKPREGDILDYWGQLDPDDGDKLEETADGILLAMGKPLWADRVSTIDTFKLNGLKIVLKNVSVPDKGCISIGVTNTEGGWVDSKGIFVLNFNTKVNESLGAVDYGYVMAKQGTDLSDVKPRVIPDAPTAATLAGTVTIEFKKDGSGNWSYILNGQSFAMDNALVAAMVPNPDKVYVSFGSWGTSTGPAVSYVIADLPIVAAAPTTKPTATKAPTAAVTNGATVEPTLEATPTTEAGTTPEITSAVTPDPTTAATPTSAPAPSDGSSSTGTVILIVGIVALVGAGVFLFFKLRKK